MNLTSPKILRETFKKHDFKPQKRLGQNFLIDQNIVNKIVKIAQISKKDTILEIGPGTGAITKALAQKSKKVIAVEKDPQLSKILKENLSSFKNTSIITSDIRRTVILGQSFFDSPSRTVILGQSLKDCPWKVVANLPYYLSQHVIRKLLELENQPEKIVLLVQKELAQRICAKPPRMNILAVSVQFYSQPEIKGYVSKTCFWPQPKVDSAIIEINPLEKTQEISSERFFKTVKAGFFAPRKQLANNLTSQLKKGREGIIKAIKKTGIEEKARAENLTIKEWINLSRLLT